MPKTVTNLVPAIFTRRALVSAIQSHQHGGDAPKPLPQSTRQQSRFPLTLTIGLMTVGVIVIVSALQLLSSYLG